ncbi:MAG: hypothetical protein M3046_01605 [Actinomycetota bacterium]|nr:hypothetical protein [Actinomycetota bacterium]
MRRARPWPLIAFFAWTVFVWAGRIRNGGSVVLAASFLLLAAVAIWRGGRWITALAVWTIGVWAVRTPYILMHDHPAGFKVVHTVLAAISIALAISAQRHVQREREAAATPARL